MNKPIEIELSSNTANLYIFFGGIASGIAIPPFEFYNSAKILTDNKFFIRDFAQCWYQDGLPGISHDIHTTAKFIHKEIQRLNPEKVFFVGNSMGGYAAILFAKLIGRGEVIAFAPQTFISPFLRLKYRDRRWPKQIFNTYKKSLLKRKIWNLKPLLKKGHTQKISIFVSKNDQLDHIHAQHLNNIPGVRIFEFSSGDHDIVKVLRDEGKLPVIMSGSYN